MSDAEHEHRYTSYCEECGAVGYPLQRAEEKVATLEARIAELTADLRGAVADREAAWTENAQLRADLARATGGAPSCECRTPGFGIQRNTCLSPLRAVCQCDCHVESLDPEPVHLWFELSYAQYLTVPRSVLQSMPVEWQARFAGCLEELDEAIDWRPAEGRYWVRLKDGKGRFVRDPLMEYDRGRRRVPLRAAPPNLGPAPQTNDDPPTR